MTVEEMDNFRSLEDIIKQRLNGTSVILGVVNKDGNFITYIDPEIDDLNLVYLIKCLEDRRVMRLTEEV